MKNKVFIMMIAVIFIAGIIGSVIVLTAPQKSTVRIVSDGTVVDTVDLRTAQDRTFDVTYEGHVNTVEIKDHRIRIKDADCPDRTCVNMGWLSSASMPIVCLPHRLVIEFTDGADVDAVTR
ncbi:MAG: NusG domain II-containing protein [Ruminococcus sp.]|nr:NusG domain II-containing protein [Ruminococcus sp.]